MDFNTLGEYVEMPLHFGTGKSVKSKVIYTPSESLQDETSSMGTVTMEDEWLDNRPKTS